MGESTCVPALVACLFIASVLALVIVCIPCVLIDPTYCPIINETMMSESMARLANGWTLQAQDQHILPLRKRSLRDTSGGHFNDLPEEEQPEPTKNLHHMKDYEMDYPQIYEAINPSTTRIPSKFQLYPNRGLVHAKCEKEDEDKMFADHTWCRMYFHCFNGSISVYVCPELTVFRPQMRGCDQKRSYDCMSPITNVDIVNLRKLMMAFYMTADLKDLMMKELKPASDVIFPPEPPVIKPPHFSNPDERNIFFKKAQRAQQNTRTSLWYRTMNRKSGF